ncbi:MAG: GntR family transcriptional regulator, partial [Lysobacteraceae bacterium]
MRIVPAAPTHQSLHDEVAARLREHIFSGEFAPGSFLDEAALCER